MSAAVSPGARTSTFSCAAATSPARSASRSISSTRSTPSLPAASAVVILPMPPAPPITAMRIARA
jgi:hypothetical protein